MFRNQLIPHVLFAALLTASLDAYAATASFSIVSANAYGNAYYVPQSFGYQFTPATDILVSSLGFFDYLGDGLGESHTVGIFNADGKLLTSTVVSSGTGNVLDDGFRYSDISPITLNAGQTYTAAALFLTNADVVGYASVGEMLANPAITVGSLPARYIIHTGSEIQFPTQTGGLGGGAMYYDANFKLAPVPIPGAIWLFASALAGFGFIKSKRG